MSGRFLAMFDPHCDFLTGVDASNPGLRIEFTKHAVATTHPAQFAGFTLFGCDMKAPFDGTLFRFPLRTGAQAAVSRLSKQAHSVDNMRAMLRGFAREACDCMLFLKAVQRIEVYEHSPGATEPTRLFVTTVQCTPEGRVERNAFTRLTAAAASTSSSTTQATSVYTAQFRTESEPGSDISCDVSVTYLFSQALGGGRSQAVAQAGQQRYGMRLLPWASVAARVDGPALDAALGKAFCFLPLPVHTGLPVHVNAFFELSSNRRDIWYGDDMAGGGALRSEWNSVLLTDVVAPAYARLLAEAPRLRSVPSDVYGLWPPSQPVEPWGACVRAVYAALPPLRVLHTRMSGGQWISPREALLPDRDVQASLLLQEACALENVPLAAALPPTCSSLLTAHAGDGAIRTVTPEHLRAALRAPGPHPASQRRDMALACLAWLLSDLADLTSPATAASLNGVPLLPLADGTVTAFDATGKRVYCTTDLEHGLFGSTAPRLCIDRDISDAILVQLHAIAGAGHTNLRLVDAAALADQLLGHILPPHWRGQSSVSWTPDDEHCPVSRDTLDTLWRRLSLCTDALHAFATWPLLPTTSGKLLAPVRAAPLVAPGLDERVTQALQCAGVHTLRGDVAVPHALLSSHVFAATVGGVIAALHPSAGQALASQADDAQRRCLAAFLLHPAHWDALAKVGPREVYDQQVAAVRSLPIFETHGDASAFVPLPAADKPFFLAPAVDPALLSSAYVKAPAPDAARVLAAHFGVSQRSRSSFFREDVTLPSRWQALPKPLRQGAALTILRELPALCAEDADFVAAMSGLAFVPTPSGQARCPAQLYDPHVTDLLALLDPGTCFPAPPFDSPELVAPLAALGLRRSVTQAVVLDAARGVAALAGRGDMTAAVDRGAALLRYLDVELGRLLDPDLGKPLTGVLKSLGGLVNADVRSQRSERENSRAAFLGELRTIQWCPVLTQPLEAGMPWPTPTAGDLECTASPADTRPRGDAWVVSASARLLAVECRAGPGSVAHFMGWTDPPSTRLLAAQLVALGERHVSVTDTAVGQSLAGAVPRLYTQLSRRSEDIASVAETLREARSIWTGAGFAQPRDVAFLGPVTLAPYLHVLPADLACFRGLLSALGVRDAFGPLDFRHVLRRLAADVGDTTLGDSQLTMAVWILQQLADSGASAGAQDDADMYVPDAAGVLRPASGVAFNDAPWLGAPDPSVVLAHPLLSHSVAEAAGVRSMRRILLAESAAAVELGLAGASAEAFGQSEALTTRLRHIIDSYADGPGILMELVQNADDAGAGHVAFLLDEGHYGTQSLLGGRMADWQGPALLCYNDRVFAPSDFAAISRIGQDSKVEKPAAAGRFGLGFNSVYHLTDVPAFVSGEYLVTFDPHAVNLPGTSAAHPGLKINFSQTGGRLARQFPDQFAPLLRFGNTMTVPFNGTLFRFPLRTPDTAARSDIKNEPYPAAAVRDLLRTFQESVSHTLLFLKHVRRISVYVRSEGEPRLWYDASLDTPGGVDPRQPAVAFVASGGAKKQFNQLLERTPEAQLPTGIGRVAVSLRLGDDHDAVPQLARTDTYLLCSSIGGGRARSMATKDVSSRGLVPWAGVAALLSPDDGEQQQQQSPLRGRAFCFLPLPVHTGLPVHVNAYFELSSNRRDIWYGDDMAGGGALRSEWNTVLLADVVAPAYARLLAEAATQLGATPAYFALFPDLDGLTEPWRSSLALRLYACLAQLPVLPTAAGAWLCPNKAVLPDHTAAGLHSELQAALIAEGLAMASPAIPQRICNAFAAAGTPGLRLLTPGLVRDVLRADRVPHPCLKLRAPALAALDYCLSDILDDDKDSVAGLLGVPLIPLADREWARFATASAQRAAVYVPADENMLRLLTVAAPSQVVDVAALPAAVSARFTALADSRVLNVARITPAALASLMPKVVPPAWRGAADVTWMPGQKGQPTEETLRLLWTCLAQCESLEPFAAWPLVPTSTPGEEAGPVVLVPASAAACVIARAGWSDTLQAGVHAAGCRMLAPGFPEVEAHVWVRDQCLHQASPRGVLTALLLRTGWPHTRVPPPQLCALAQQRLGPASVSDAERTELRGFLLQAKWHSTDKPLLSDAHLGLLCALPIFETFGGKGGTTRFVALADGVPRTLPPALPDLDISLFDASVVRPASSREAAVLAASCGVKPAPKAQFLRSHVLRSVSQLAPAVRDSTFAALLGGGLADVCSEDDSFLQVLADTAFVPVAGGAVGAVAKPSRLYDPRIETVATLLHGTAAFPAAPFDTPPMLDGLLRLGLRRTLGAQGVLDAAAGAEALATQQGPQAGAARGAALLLYLNSLDDPDEAAAGAQDVGAFWTALRSCSWCPVQVEPGDVALPWPAGVTSAMRLAPPRMTRPAVDAWLVSAQCRLLDAEAPIKAELSDRLGWATPPSAPVLAAQVLELSKRHAAAEAEAAAEALALQASDAPPTFAPAVPAATALAALNAALDASMPRLYAALATHTRAEDIQVVKAILDGAPCVWLSSDTASDQEQDGGAHDRRFITASLVAFEAVPAYAPYLHPPPACITQHRQLLLALGAIEVLRCDHLCAALRRVAAEFGSGPVTEEVLPLTAEFAERAAECLPPGAKPPVGVYLPDARGVLTPASELLFNDASWLAPDGAAEGGENQLRLVHSCVSLAAAERLGAKSLRLLFLVDQQMTDRLPCPPAAGIASLLGGYQDADCLLWDLLEVADAAGATSVEVTLDTRQHGKQSLLSPLLAPFQGPALMVRLDVVLEAHELCTLLASTPPIKLRGRACRFGNGLLSAFHVTDLPCALCGPQLLMFDPSGAVLGRDSQAGGSAAAANKPLGKAYTFVGNDLPRRFGDQFAPYAETGVDLSQPYNGTLLRLPLRSATASQLGRPPCGVTDAEALLAAAAATGDTALIFAASLTRLKLRVWRADEAAPSAAVLDVAVAQCDPDARALCDDKDWRKTGLLNFLSGTPAVRRTSAVTLAHRRGSSPAVTDQYVVCAVIGGSGKAKDTALDRKHLAHMLLPYAAAAVHLTRDGGSPPAQENSLFAPLPLHGDASGLNKLPFALMASFAVTRAEGRRLHPLTAPLLGGTPGAIQWSAWNRDLLAVAASAAADVLTETSRISASRASGDDSALHWQYTLWPRRSALSGSPDADTVEAFFLTPLYTALADRPLLRLRSGAAVRASDALFLPDGGDDMALPGGGTRAVAYLAAHHPVVSAPPSLRAEFLAAGVQGVKELTPGAIRKLLRSTTPPSGVVNDELVETYVELMGCCFADLIAPPNADAASTTPVTAAAAALGAAPGSATASMAALLDESGVFDAGTIREVADHLPSSLRDTATEMLTGVGLGGTTTAETGPWRASDHPPLHTLRLRELLGVPCPTVDGRLVAFGSGELLVAAPSAGAVLALNPAACKGKVAHRRCVDVHSRFFTHPGFQAALRLAPATLAKLAPLVRDMLPRACVVSAGGPVVPWPDRAAPPEAWVRDFWSHFAAVAPREATQRTAVEPLLDLFAPMALIPLREGGLCRVGDRHMVLLPPGPWCSDERRDAAWMRTITAAAANMASALDLQVPGGAQDNNQMGDAQAEEGGRRCPSMRALWPVTERIATAVGAPMLDTERMPEDVVRYFMARHTTGAEDLLRRLCAAARADCLDFSRLAAGDRDDLLALAAASRFHVCDRGWLAGEAGTHFLRTLPCFQLASGGHTALDSYPGELSTRLVTITTPNCGLLVTTALGTVPELLAPPATGEATLLFTTLGVPLLSDGDLLARMVLPRFTALSGDNRDAVLGHVAGHWARLKSQPEVVAALRATRFVHASTPSGDEPADSDDDAQLRSPGELLDPQSTFLAAAFAEQRVFPSRRWRTPAWLPILRVVGLCQGLDAPALISQAQRLQQAWATAVAEQNTSSLSPQQLAATEAELHKILAAAEALVSHMHQQAGKYTAADCTQLSSIPFVPAIKPGTPGGAAVAAMAASDSVAAHRCLAALAESVAPEHWALAWAKAPTLLPQCVPPTTGLRSRLGVRSPPPFAFFVAHLHACAGDDYGESLLASWPVQAGHPEAAFSAAMAHLAELWPTLSTAEIGRIRGAAFVPVSNASRLVAPDSLFIRCPVNIEPLAFELPPQFAAHAGIMRGLGTRDAPTPVDIAAMLRSAAQSCGAQPLGPNELQAALRCAVVLADALHRDTEVPIPDAEGVLVPARDCVRLPGAKPSTRRWALHAGAQQLRFVHPQLGAVPRVCVGLGVPSLSEVVVEALTAPLDILAAQLPALSGPDGGQLSAERVAARIAAPEFLTAAHAVISSSAGGTDLTSDDISAAFRAVASRLVFVPHLTVAVHTRVAAEARAPEVSRPFFDDPVSGKLLVAQPQAHASPADVISAALSDVLCLPAPLPLAHLLTCPDAGLHSVALDLCDMCVVPTGGSATAGCVGLVVTPAHAALAQFKPLRPFREGEICAWRPPAPVLPPAEASRAAALARASGGQAPAAQQAALRYVRVVADAAVSPGAVVYPVTVEMAPGEIRTLLSTEVMSFRGTSAVGARPGDEPAVMEQAAVTQPATSGTPQPVMHASDAARAVRDLLAAADLPLDLDRDTLLQKTMDMQARLRQAEAAAATAATAAEAATAESEAVCRTLICPITHALMDDPVMCSDGHSYERAAIRHWLASANTSPVTNRQLSDRTLLPNHAVKAAVAALKERQRRAQGVASN